MPSTGQVKNANGKTNKKRKERKGRTKRLRAVNNNTLSRQGGEEKKKKKEFWFRDWYEKNGWPVDTKRLTLSLKSNEKTRGTIKGGGGHP